MTTSGSNPSYASVHRRAKWVIGFFVVMIVGSLLAAAISLWTINLGSRCLAGAACTPAEAQALELSEMVLGIVQFGVFWATSIMFLVWLHGAYKYTSTFASTPLQFTPGWAVGWWFVPILSWWKPYQAMRELWQASMPSADSTNPAQPPKFARMLVWWWVAYLTMNAVSAIETRSYNAASTVNDIINASWISMGSIGVTIVAAMLTIYVVRTIDRFQAMDHVPTTPSYQVPLQSAPAY